MGQKVNFLQTPADCFDLTRYKGLNYLREGKYKFINAELKAISSSALSYLRCRV